MQTLTSLVFHQKLQVLDVITEDVTSLSRKGEVGRQCRVSRDHVGRRIPRATIGIGSAREKGGNIGGAWWYLAVRERHRPCESEAPQECKERPV